VIDIVEMPETVLASVRARVAWPELPRAIRAGLDRVWAFLRTAPVRPAGHNVCVYRAPAPDGIELEAGVQVSGPFEGAGGVACSATPSGRAAHIVHLGRYEDLGAASDALAEFCRARGAGVPVVVWEVYGDWAEDPAQLRTDVYQLL
jgi:effector-binding domain-containing protein